MLRNIPQSATVQSRSYLLIEVAIFIVHTDANGNYLDETLASGNSDRIRLINALLFYSSYYVFITLPFRLQFP